MGLAAAFMIGRRHTLLQEHLLQTKMSMENIDRKLTLFAELKEKLGQIQSANLNMVEMSRELAGGISNLRNIFTAGTTRGISGEVMLENLLKQFVPHNYEMQYSLGSEKIDAVIKLDKMLVPVDAKFPHFDRFNEMLNIDATTETGEKERQKRKKELVRSVREMIDDVQRKYIRPDLNTSNFAMIYIPAENIYYELVVNDKDMEIANFANQRNVVLVSPSTMFSYLMIVQWGLKGLKLEGETKFIFQRLESLAKEMGNFKSDFDVLAGHLTRAYNKLNETSQSLLKVEARFESVLLTEGGK